MAASSEALKISVRREETVDFECSWVWVSACDDERLAVVQGREVIKWAYVRYALRSNIRVQIRLRLLVRLHLWHDYISSHSGTQR